MWTSLLKTDLGDRFDRKTVKTSSIILITISKNIYSLLHAKDYVLNVQSTLEVTST